MRTFPLADILTITTGYMVAPIGRLYESLHFLTGTRPYTHQIIRACHWTAPRLLQQFPILHGADPTRLQALLAGAPNDRESRQLQCDLWVEETSIALGLTELELEPYPGWGSLDPVTEFRAMNDPQH